MPTAIGSEIVCRAVGLVLDGVLDDETDLTITEVGFAAGFGSTRQFNRVCRSVFRHTPQELRTKRRRSDRHVADGGLTLRLAMHGRLDWPAMIDALDLAAVPGVEAVTGERYVRTIAVNGDPGVLELSRGDDDQPLLRLHLPYWRKLVHVVQRARRIMNLDQELTEPRACLGEDPIIGPLVRARPDVRPPGTWDGFEVGVQALLDRDAADPTRALLSRVVRRYGAPVAGLTELGLTHTFPTPEVLAEADLGWLDLPQTTQCTVRTFAAAAAAGALRLTHASLPELLESLSSLGPGDDLAHHIGYRSGAADAFPLARHQSTRILDRHAVPPSEFDGSERWSPWRALAVAHLQAADATTPIVMAETG